MSLFTAGDRARASEYVLELAERDPRIVAGAVVGALAEGEGDRYSDLDLTLGVEGATVADVLADWTAELARELEAVHLFDLPVESTVYRVFLLPGCLQVDLSFTPAAEFGARGPRFRLLFGQAVERPFAQEPAPRHLLGLGAHHAVRARFCIERGRLWEAEYWISALRDHALELACLRHALPVSYGRGFDGLPAEVREPAQGALVRSLDRDELLRALRQAAEALLREGREAGELAEQVEPLLRDLLAEV